ncbi:MAG: two-component regulator propeller domain-containing protein [Nitrospinota bacterium]
MKTQQYILIGIFGAITAAIGIGVGVFLSKSDTPPAPVPVAQGTQDIQSFHGGNPPGPLPEGVAPSVAPQAARSFNIGKPSNVVKFDVGPRNVKAMLADGQTLWVGTSEGVVKHNMVTEKYEVFNNKNTSLISNGIFYLNKIGDVLFVGTYGGGMSTYDGKNWKNYNIPQGLADPFVYGAIKAANGDIWIATWSGANQIVGGDLDDPKAWKTFTEENTKGGLPNDWVYGVSTDANGIIWLATEGGLARYDGNSWQNWNHEKGLGAPYEKVKDALLKTKDPATKSKHHARQKVEMGLKTIDVPFNPNYIVSMLVDSKGRIWCGTWGGGLSIFENGKFTTYTTVEGLAGNYVSVLKEAPDGTFWVGANQGLSKVVVGDDNKLSFVNFSKEDGLYSNYIFSMAFADDKSTWVGSYGGVAHFLKGLN